MSLKWQCIVLDCVNPVPLARWWADLLGWRITFEEADEIVLEPPEGSPEDGASPDIPFGRVPEVARLRRSERAIDAGQDDTVTWVALADTEGSKFCILRAPTADDAPEANAARGRAAAGPARGHTLGVGSETCRSYASPSQPSPTRATT